MFARYGDTRGMDHMRLHPMRTKPARQPEAVSTSLEGQCNPRDLAAGLDRLVAPAMQQAKQPFCTRLQLLAWLALDAGKHTGNQPTRLAHLDDGAISPPPAPYHLAAGAKEIRTLRPTLNASVPRGATWVPRTAPGFGVAPVEGRLRDPEIDRGVRA